MKKTNLLKEFSIKALTALAWFGDPSEKELKKRFKAIEKINIERIRTKGKNKRREINHD